MFSYNQFRFKYQRYAIQNLSTYVSVAFSAGCLIRLTMPELFNLLLFYPNEVLHGQIWRILTTVVYPPIDSDVFFMLLGVYVYYSMSTTLERWWGSFNFNIYFFSSLILSELGSLVLFWITGFDLPLIPSYMYFSVFLAYAITFPEASFLLFFVLPIKAKYLAIAEGAIYLYNFLTGGLISRVYILCAMIPVLVYLLTSMGGLSGIRRAMEQKKRQKDWRDQWR